MFTYNPKCFFRRFIAEKRKFSTIISLHERWNFCSFLRFFFVAKWKTESATVRHYISIFMLKRHETVSDIFTSKSLSLTFINEIGNEHFAITLNTIWVNKLRFGWYVDNKLLLVVKFLGGVSYNKFATFCYQQIFRRNMQHDLPAIFIRRHLNVSRSLRALTLNYCMQLEYNSSNMIKLLFWLRLKLEEQTHDITNRQFYGNFSRYSVAMIQPSLTFLKLIRQSLINKSAIMLNEVFVRI